MATESTETGGGTGCAYAKERRTRTLLTTCSRTSTPKASPRRSWSGTQHVPCRQAVHQHVDRNYPKWLKSAKFGKSNIANVVNFANKWMEIQGAGTEGGYCHNSGRKSLARWLDKLNVTYRWSFEIHGDLEKVWRSNYQPTLPKSGYKKRAQSRDPNETCHALRRFAKWIDRGCERKAKYKLDVNAQLSTLSSRSSEPGRWRTRS